jgi:hypothetical protein
MPIDYERAKKESPRLKAALTRALNQTNLLNRRLAVINACKQAVAEWDIWGAWPDGWHRWNIALQDVTRCDGNGPMTLDSLR